MIRSRDLDPASDTGFVGFSNPKKLEVILEFLREFPIENLPWTEDELAVLSPPSIYTCFPKTLEELTLHMYGHS